MNNNKFSKKTPPSSIGRKTSDNEKGIALLFTLGFLALLLVIALAFATTSITQKKMAGNNNDTTYAKLLAESAVQRVIGILQLYDEGAQYSHCDNTTHPLPILPPLHPEYAKNYATLDWLHKLGTANAFHWYDSYATPANINWEYIKQYDSDAKTDKIRGRIAYVVIPGGGIDPVKLVKNGVDEGNSYPESRKGDEINEINIRSLDGNNSIFSASADVTKFSYVFDNGLLTPASPNGTWTDFENMFSLMGIPDTANTKKNTLIDWFVLNTEPDAEAFWMDKPGIGKNKIDFNPLYPSSTNAGVDELFHRFNLARFTDTNANGVYDTGVDTNLWDSTTLNDIVPNIITGAGTWPTNADVYAKPSSLTINNGICIPWLEDFGDPGTFPDAASRSKQIAANLIDYCDGVADGDGMGNTNASRHEVTRDSNTDPTYTGNELTPYINEIGVKVECVASSVDIGGAIYQNQYALSVSIGGEIINIFAGNGVNLNKIAYLHILEGKITYTYKNPDGTTAPRDIPLTGISDTTGMTIGTDGYKFRWFGTASDSHSTASSSTPSSGAEISNVKVQISKVLLNYDGDVTATNFADFAKPDDAVAGDFSNIDANTISCAIGGASLSPAPSVFHFSYQALDSRQNLNNGDWPTATAGFAADDPAGYDTVGSSNLSAGGINVNLTAITIAGDADGDIKTGGLTPTTLSTAYIRNDIMQSPWELGAIHRGAKWETLNLKEYNNKWGVNKTGGGNKYYSDVSDGTFTLDGGDANILDQIKMTRYTTSDKKLNLKLHKDSILYSLFHKVKLGQDYATFSGGTDLTPAKIWNFTSTDTMSLLYQLKEKNINFYSRGCLAQVLRLSDGTCGTQTNDKEKEEIIGKVINLTSISTSDYFTIIVLAQTIKDIGGGITINKDLDMNGTIGTASELVLHTDINGNNNATDAGISETISTCDFGAYDQYADEILAEQKIKAEIYRDPDTKKIKVLRYEYIEE